MGKGHWASAPKSLDQKGNEASMAAAEIGSIGCASIMGSDVDFDLNLDPVCRKYYQVRRIADLFYVSKNFLDLIVN